MLYCFDEYIDYVKSRIATEKKNKTYSTKLYGAYRLGNVFSAIEYLVATLATRGLHPPYKGIQLRDHEQIKNSNILDKKYYRRIELLQCLGIINSESRYYVPKKQSIKYDINASRLFQVLNDAIEKDEENKLFRRIPECSEVCPIFEIDMEWLRDALTTGVWYPIKDATDEDVETCSNIFNQIDNCDDMDTFYITTENKFTPAQISYIKQYYFKRIIGNDTTYQKCAEMRDDVNVLMNFNVRMKETKTGYMIYTSARQTNEICNTKKEYRAEILKKEGLDGEFDLHSAIFGVARLLNTGKFDCDWDIKDVIDYAAYDLDRDTFKSVLFRVFFSGHNSWRDYVHMCVTNHMNPIEKNRYWELYNECQEVVGGTAKYVTSIFIYESYLELSVLTEMKKRNLSYRNVFDCFYFKTSEISVEEVKAIINEKAQDLYQQYHQSHKQNKVRA